MKTVVVTGASGMLGSAICKAFTEHGWDVTKLPHGNMETYKETPDAVVHAAWPKFARTKLDSTPKEEIETQFGAAQASLVFLSSVGKRMQERGSGTIIGITTEGLDDDEVGAYGAYLPAKAALREILKILKHQLPSVAVHEVTPSFMRGGLNSDLPERFFEMIDEKGWLENPADVAERMVALAETSSR